MNERFDDERLKNWAAILHDVSFFRLFFIQMNIILNIRLLRFSSSLAVGVRCVCLALYGRCIHVGHFISSSAFERPVAGEILFYYIHLLHLLHVH